MKHLVKIGLAATFVLAAALIYFALHADENPHNPLIPDTSASLKKDTSFYNKSVSKITDSVSVLSENEKQGLILMREEEKLAHDVFATLSEAWDIAIFINIHKSETSHMKAMHGLLKKYHIPDPVAGNQTGIFTNNSITGLYQTLIIQGKKSLVDALKAGAYVEESSISDLREYINSSDNEDIKKVYENLLQASYNHFRTFSKNLTFRDATYTPHRLSQMEIDEILDAGK